MRTLAIQISQAIAQHGFILLNSEGGGNQLTERQLMFLDLVGLR